MGNYNICTDFIEIIAGTNNTIMPAYMEAKSIKEDTSKSMKYLKNFITSIENIASKEEVKDERISKTRGNIKQFSGYENVKTAMEFLKSNLKGLSLVNDLGVLYDTLEKYQAQYTDGYERNVRLVVLEYESALYLLVTGLSMSLANNIDVVQNGYQIKIQKRSANTHGVIEKTIHDFVKVVSNKDHGEYLKGLITANDVKGVNTNIEESYTFMESIVTDSLALIDSIFSNVGRIGRFAKNTFLAIKNSIFGIVPLIRSILYLRYKKKADTVLALEQQIMFIERNIEQLTNIKNMDEAKKAEIIKKQKAVIETYRKKAEKLRAELSEGEKDAAIAIKKEDPEMKKVNDDDEFILEGVSISDMFTEATAESLRKRRENAFFKRLKKENTKSSSFRSNFSSGSNDKTAGKKLDMNLLNKVLDEFHKKYSKKTVRLELTKGKAKDITSSKLGGQPYWPKDMEYPTSKRGDMVLLAQLNFNELPHIPDYPTSGILQFFVVDGDCENDDCSKMKVIYHEKIDKNNADTSERKTMDNGEYPVFTGEYGITGKIKDMYPCDVFSDTLNDAFMPIFNKYFNTDIKSVTRIDDVFNDKDTWNILYDRLVKEVESWGTRIGGYPNFTQWDPRVYKDHNNRVFKYDALLLQIDSDGKGIMWGDYGVANIFIDSEKLKKKDFSDIFFTWDCY